MEDHKLYEVLAQIHEQLAMIATHLDTLAKAARHQHPEAFAKPGQQRSQAKP